MTNQPSFDEMMGDQMRRAPWLLVSVGGHGVLLLMIWLLHRPEVPAPELPVATVAMEDVVPEDVDDPIVEPPPIEPVPPTTVDDLVPKDEPDTMDQSDDASDVEEDRGDEAPSEAPAFSASSEVAVVGIGGGAPGDAGARRGGRRDASKGGGRRIQDRVDAGLEWLARHQTRGVGHWDADGFMANGDPARGPLCDGKGGPLYDVGLTGLALLAFLGAGETHTSGDYRGNVKDGLKWLVDQQDAEGCFGSRSAQNFLYGHALATLAMCEAYGLTRSPLFRGPAQRGLDFVGRCQNPYGAWRYGVADGENDVSVTGWMVMALKSGKSAGLEVDDRRLAWAVDFIDAMTDPETGRTGYMTRGGRPVREVDLTEAFPAEESESLTAVGVLCRVFAGQDPATTRSIAQGAGLLTEKLPVWDEARGSIDMYYWYYGTLAAYQVAGSTWNTWNEKMQEAVVETQRADGNFAGSWDPKGAWGEAGGRVYATAMLTLCLEVYYRYARVFGTR